MRVLPDTHIFLWWIDDHPRLSRQARKQIAAADTVFVSSASIWELAIKVALGKINLDIDRVVAEITRCGFDALPISVQHAASVAQLPAIHRDPFDRILVAQCVCGPFRLITADRALLKYSALIMVV